MPFTFRKKKCFRDERLNQIKLTVDQRDENRNFKIRHSISIRVLVHLSVQHSVSISSGHPMKCFLSQIRMLRTLSFHTFYGRQEHLCRHLLELRKIMICFLFRYKMLKTITNFNNHLHHLVYFLVHLSLLKYFKRIIASSDRTCFHRTENKGACRQLSRALISSLLF